MQYSTVLVSTADHISTLTLNRPDKLNALNDEMAVEFLNAFAAAEKDPEVRVIVLSGAGRAFSAGADLQESFLNPVLEGKPSQVLSGWPEEACALFRRTTKPVIASINGPAIGFGCAVCLACDIRIASKNARMGLGFVRIGTIPGDGATFYLPRLVGMGKACELVFTSKVIDAYEAEKIGMVNRVVDEADLKDATYELAKTLVAAPPLALYWAKQALYQSLDSSFSSQIRFETIGQATCHASQDFIEAIKSFLEKRSPNYTGK